MKRKGRFIRCDESFYDLIKDSGYSAPVFTRKLAEELKKSETSTVKKQNTIWGFRL